MDSKPRILVIDDDHRIIETTEAILKAEGYEVDTAETGKEAIAKSEKAFYNIALVDIRLPDCEGTQLLLKLKEWTPRTRKIIITGYPTMQNAISAVNQTADAFMVKPVDIPEMLQTIKEQLKKQEAENKFNQAKVVEFIETRVQELAEVKG